MRDMYNRFNPVASIDPIVCNNDTEGTGVGVDLQGFEGALAIFHAGVSGDTLSGTVKLQAILEESDDNVTFTAVAAADMLGEDNFALIDAAAEDAVVQCVGYIGAQRYIRVRVDITGTHTNGIPLSAVIVRGYPRHAPVDNTPVPAA